MKSQLPEITIATTAAEVLAQPDRSPQPTQEELNQRMLQCMTACAKRLERWLVSGTGTEFRFAMDAMCGPVCIDKYGAQLAASGFTMTFSDGMLRVKPSE